MKIYTLKFMGALVLSSALTCGLHARIISPFDWDETPESHNKGLYGDDNRRLISELNASDDKEDEVRVEMSRAVLAQIPRWRMTATDDGDFSVETKSLAAGLNFCPEEKFSDLPLVSSCTAFLVGPDLLMTAGHCVKDKYECQKNYWVLDYNDALGFSGPQGAARIKKENVVYCQQILSQSENVKLDYALIRITRKIKDRKPLTIRRTGKVEDDDTLEVIGHPLGLPKVLTDEASIRNNSLPFTFVTNADTFSGNSGSPVINSKTHVVEGILVRGDEDFQMDIDRGCNHAYHCLADECKGETVQRTSVLPLKLIPKI